MASVDTSYLTSQVNQIVGELHGLFDEIGVPAHERDEREAEVCEYSCFYFLTFALKSGGLVC